MIDELVEISVNEVTEEVTIEVTLPNVGGGLDGNDFVTGGVIDGNFMRLNIPNQTQTIIDVSPLVGGSEIGISAVGLLGDYDEQTKTGTENSAAFATLVQQSEATGKYIQFPEGNFLINGNDINVANVKIRGAGKGLTKIINTDGRAVNLFTVTESVDVQDITIKGYNWIFESGVSLDEVKFHQCYFADNRNGVFHLKELAGAPTSHVEKLSITKTDIFNTPGIFVNGTVGEAYIGVNNTFKKWLRDLSIWTVDVALTRNFSIQIGNAYSADGSLTVDQTQDLVGDIRIVGNQFSQMDVPISNGVDILGIFVVGNNVTISNNTQRDIRDTTETAIDVAGIYIKSNTCNVSGSTLTNVGSQVALGEGAITVKGYKRDGTPNTDGSRDGVAYLNNINNNTIKATLPNFETAFWLTNDATEVFLSNNFVEGYNHAFNNAISNSRFSNNIVSNIKKEILRVNWPHELVDFAIDGLTVLNYKPVDNTSLFYLRKTLFENVSFKNISITIDLENFTENELNLVELISNAGVVNNIDIKDVTINIINSPLTGSQNIVKIGSALIADYNVQLNGIKIITDGSETWEIKDDSNAYYDNVITENFYVNGKKLISGGSDNIFQRAVDGDSINLVSTSDSRQDAYYARYNEYAAKQFGKIGVEWVDDNLSGQTTSGWASNTSYNGQSTFNNVIANIPGTGKNTIWIWSLGHNDPTSTKEEYKDLWRPEIQSVLDVRPDTTLVFSNPIYAAGDEVKYAVMIAAQADLSIEFGAQVVSSYAFLQANYELGVTHWNSVHIDYYGARIDIDITIQQLVPNHLLNRIDIPKIQPYKTGLPSGNLAEGLSPIPGFWGTASNISNESPTKRKFPEIYLPENVVVRYKHQGNDPRVTLLNADGDFLAGYNPLTRDDAEWREFTTPIGTAIARFNLHGSDAAAVAAYDALNDVVDIRYKQDAISKTAQELNDGAGITMPYAKDYESNPTPFLESAYLSNSREVQKNFQGYLTETLEPEIPTNIFPDGDAGGVGDGVDITGYIVQNGTSVVTLETTTTNGSTNAVKIADPSGGLEMAQITVDNLKPNTTYDLSADLYINRFWPLRFFDADGSTLIMDSGATNDAFVAATGQFTTGASETSRLLRIFSGNGASNIFGIIDNLQVIEVVETVVPMEFSTDQLYVKSVKINEQTVVDLRAKKAANIYINSEGTNLGTNNLEKAVKALAIPVSGTTANRPSSPLIGVDYFDTDLGHKVTFNGTNWVDASGTTV